MASNANVNKVVYGGNVLVDLTGDTVAADKLLSGYAAHDRSGARVTGSIPSKAAQTYTPGTGAQTIAAGQYLAGAQTIRGDANLVAGNIAEGVSIFGVTGTHGGSAGSNCAPNDVNFFDYDGTIVYSCSAAEFANLAAMPANPAHTDRGLTAQGWNWSLADAKAYVAAYGILDIGQMYAPADGKTHIFITIDNDRPVTRRTFNLRFQASVNQGVEIDWGDGSAVELSSGTIARVYTHTYAANGDYEVKLNVLDGSMTFPGTDGDGGFSLSGSRAKGPSYGVCFMIRRVYFGSGIQTIGNCALHSCHGNVEVVIPRGVTKLGNNLFYNNYQLSYCTIPDTVTDTGGGVLQNCYHLLYVSIPRSLTDVKDYDFYNCYSLRRIAIPDSVTTMGMYTIGGAHTIQKVVLPNSITSIGSGLIQNADALRELTLPANLTGTLGQYTASNCHSLIHIDIPSGITEIANSAFSYCYSLMSVTIPATVQTIGNAAFRYNYGMGEYHIRATTPPTIGTTVFNNYPSDCVIYVPYSADHSVLEAYRTATNWSTYASLMVEEPQ